MESIFRSDKKNTASRYDYRARISTRPGAKKPSKREAGRVSNCNSVNLVFRALDSVVRKPFGRGLARSNKGHFLGFLKNRIEDMER